MKEKRIKRKWQRPLMVVAMLLTFALSARAQVKLEAIDAGLDESGKWWVKLYNPTEEDITVNGKLGICFFISTNPNTSNPDDDLGKKSLTWNDEMNLKFAKKGEKQLTANGGYKKGTSGDNVNNDDFIATYMQDLTVGETYYLNIKIQDNDNVSGTVKRSYVGAKFVYNGYIDGKPSIKDFVKLSGFYKKTPEGYTAIKIDDINYLVNKNEKEEGEEAKKYAFNGLTNIAQLWRDAKGTSDKVYTFGWFDEQGQFNGITGYYKIVRPTDTGRNEYGDNYYDIIPVYGDGPEKDQNKHLQYATDGNSLDLSDGALYLGGSKDGFGIPEANHEWGWDGDEGKNENGKKANQEIKGSAVPQIEKGKYQFEITTGTQINAWGDDGLPLLCKLYHYKQWSHPIDGSDQRYPGYEFKRWHEGVQIESKDTDNPKSPKGYHKYTFYHVEKNTEASPLGGMFEVTQSQRKDRGDGNIHGITIGQDSYLPKFPNGYTFRFTLDLTKSTEENRLDFPLQVILAGRPDNVDGDDWYAKDGEKPDLEKNRTGDVGDITVNLNDKDGKKRIWLRDAFRLDWNIPYASSNPKAAEEDNPMKINKLTVKGELNIDDLYYLGDLVEEGKIKSINLKDAIIEGGQIPATFAQNPDPEHKNSELTSISLPANTSIGAYAFTNCTGLKEVKFAEGDNTKVMVGAGAFKGCTKLTNETVQDIINHTNTAIMTSVFEGIDNVEDIIIPSDITLINEKAFANTGLKKLTLPATCNGKNVEPQATKNWIKPGRIGNVFVKTAYNGNGNINGIDTDAAREARTIKSNEALVIDARDFNLEQSSGWFNNGDHDAAGTFDTSWRPDIKENNVGFCIYNTNEDKKLGNMQAFYWFNYSFLVEEEGDYKITAYMAAGNGDRYPEFTIDGGSDAIAIHVKTDDWKPLNNPCKVGNVHLTPGIHYITFHAAEGSDIAQIIIEHGKFEDADIQTFKVGPNKGQVITEYNLIDKEGTKPILSSHEKAFDGVTPNDCEVVFSDNTSDEMIKGYRNESTGAYAVDNSGLEMLLTKTLDENAVYSCVNQHHANVKMNRRFAFEEGRENHQNNWYSVVFPFEVNAATLINAKDENQNYVFDRAAVLDNGSFNKEGYPNVHFSYLDGQPFLAKVNFTDDHKNESWENTGNGHNNSYEIGDKIDDVECNYVYDNNGKRQPFGTNVIKAGDPFNIRIERAIDSDVTFYDVRVFPSNDKEQNVEEKDKSDVNSPEKYNKDYWIKVNKADGQDLFTFVGNMYGDGEYNGEQSHYAWLKDGYYYYSGRIYQGYNNKETYFLKALRAYLKPSDNTVAAKFLKNFLFGEPTAIGNIEAENAANGNIYNLNGQLVRKGTSVEGLPKGVLIVNGKRVVIR